MKSSRVHFVPSVGNRECGTKSPMTIHAERIRERRKTLDISQTQLAQRVGISQKQISKYETGEDEPGSAILAALANALSTSTDWLLGLTEDVKPGGIDRGLDLDETEREALQILRRCHVEKRSKIIEFMKMAAGA